MAALSIPLLCECADLVALIDELDALLHSAPAETRQAFAEAVERAGGLRELIVFDDKLRPASTGELVIAGKPTERLLHLAAALRAGDRQFLVEH